MNEEKELIELEKVMRAVVEANDGRALDDEEDREALIKALVEAHRRTPNTILNAFRAGVKRALEYFRDTAPPPVDDLAHQALKLVDTGQWDNEEYHA